MSAINHSRRRSVCYFRKAVLNNNADLMSLEVSKRGLLHPGYGGEARWLARRSYKYGLPIAAKKRGNLGGHIGRVGLRWEFLVGREKEET